MLEQEQQKGEEKRADFFLFMMYVQQNKNNEKKNNSNNILLMLLYNKENKLFSFFCYCENRGEKIEFNVWARKQHNRKNLQKEKENRHLGFVFLHAITKKKFFFSFCSLAIWLFFCLATVAAYFVIINILVPLTIVFIVFSVKRNVDR